MRCLLGRLFEGSRRSCALCITEYSRGLGGPGRGGATVTLCQGVHFEMGLILASGFCWFLALWAEARDLAVGAVEMPHFALLRSA